MKRELGGAIKEGTIINRIGIYRARRGGRDKAIITRTATSDGHIKDSPTSSVQ